jgi:hypothetical protein
MGHYVYKLGQMGLSLSLLVLLRGAPSAGVPFTIGNVFVSVSNGLVREFTPAGILVQTLNTGNPQDETAGSAFDTFGNFFVTTFSRNTVAKFDNNGNLVSRTFATGFNADPESVTFARSGNFFVGEADGLHQINEFTSTGVNVGTFDATTVPGRGTDWIDLACDQQTIYYSSEGNAIRRFDTAMNMQLSDFNSLPLPGRNAYALRILANGGVLVADRDRVVQLDNTGAVVMQYTTADTFAGQSIASLFALNLDRDGTTFWTGDLFGQTVYHVDIATGTLLGSFDAQTNGFPLQGISIYGEPTQGLCASAPGRMTGGGSVFTSLGTRVTHGLDLHCNIEETPNNLEVSWGSGNKFKLQNLTAAVCFTDTSIDSSPPAAGFNTLSGAGTGTYNGRPGATVQFKLTDAGEPGNRDTAKIVIEDDGGNQVLSVIGTIQNGNQQAHRR